MTIKSMVLWQQLVCMLLPVSAQAAVVLQYHHIGDAYPAATSVSLERFTAHMDYLHEEGFDVVSLTSLVHAIRNHQPLPDRTVAITFDDAYESVYRQAAPVLESRNWPYTVFASTEAVDRGYLGVMSWDQLRDLSQKGGDIANHTVSHAHLIRQLDHEDEDAWQQRVLAEILSAEQRIKAETGQNHKLLAFPYGEYNLDLLNLLSRQGFAGVGQQSGPLASWMPVEVLPRFPFAGHYGDLEDFKIKVNSLPLPVQGLSLSGLNMAESVEPVLSKPSVPELSLNLPVELGQTIRCYASGQGEIHVRIHEEEAIVKAPAELLPGRSRYNCTAPAGKGRFYWFSQLFIVPQKDGQWYQEP